MDGWVVGCLVGKWLIGRLAGYFLSTFLFIPFSFSYSLFTPLLFDFLTLDSAGLVGWMVHWWMNGWVVRVTGFSLLFAWWACRHKKLGGKTIGIWEGVWLRGREKKRKGWVSSCCGGSLCLPLTSVCLPDILPLTLPYYITFPHDTLTYLYYLLTYHITPKTMMTERHDTYFHAFTTLFGSKLHSIASTFHDLLLYDDHHDLSLYGIGEGKLELFGRHW